MNTNSITESPIAKLQASYLYRQNCPGCFHSSDNANLHVQSIPTAEDLEFSLPEWVTLEKFLELFPSNFQGRYEYRYGDIFIRTLIN
jgi:hypothetical protein